MAATVIDDISPDHVGRIIADKYLPSNTQLVVKQKPLSIEELNELPECGRWWPAGIRVAVYEAIRAVEKAHGIT